MESNIFWNDQDAIDIDPDFISTKNFESASNRKR